MARPSKSNKPTVKLVSPEGETVEATQLNARDLVQRGYLQKAAVDAAMEALKTGAATDPAELAAKMLKKQADEKKTKEPEKVTEKPVEKWTLAQARTSNGFTSDDDYLESLEADDLREILKKQFDEKAHHATGKTALITKIKEKAAE